MPKFEYDKYLLPFYCLRKKKPAIAIWHPTDKRKNLQKMMKNRWDNEKNRWKTVKDLQKMMKNAQKR